MSQRKRTRLAPEARRDLILDQAAALVLAEGLQAATMERLARECAISKSLVYSYFPTRDAVLAALLERDQAQLRDRGLGAALQAESFEDLIRQTSRLYLEQVSERGALAAALLADPAVAKLMEGSNRAERDRTVRYFVRAVRRDYGLPLAEAIVAVDALMNLTGGVAVHVAAGEIPVEAATEMCVRLITGGLAALARPKPAPP